MELESVSHGHGLPDNDRDHNADTAPVVIRRFFFALFLGMASFSYAAKTAEYRFENNANDSVGTRHGTLEGSGPTFNTNTAVPIEGTYAERTTPGNYITLPVTVMNGIGSTGTIKFCFFLGDTDTWIGKIPFSWTAAGGHGYVQITAASKITFQYTQAAGVTVTTSTAELRRGRFYQISIQYTVANMTVDVYDFLEETTTNFFTHVASLPVMTGVTAIVIGEYTGGGGFTSEFTVDHMRFYNDTNNTVDFTPNPQRSIVTFGDSMMLGVLIGGTCGTNKGFRGGMSDTFQASIFADYPYGTTTAQGLVFTNGTDAVAGYKLADLDGNVTAKFNAAYTTKNSKQGAVIFIGTNDAAATITAAAAAVTVVSIAGKIHALDSSIKVFFCTALDRTDGEDVTDVNIGIRNGVVTSGANTYLIETNLVPGVNLCVDGLHPDEAGYVTIGTYIAERVECVYNGCGPFPGSTMMLGVGR